MQDFRAAYNDLRSIQKNSKGTYISYSVEVVTAQGEKQVDHLTLKSVGNKSYVKSDAVTMFQDAATMVALQNTEKTIFITRPIPSEWKKAQLEGIFKVQDSLINYLNLKSCAMDMVNAKKLQKLVFEPKGRLKDRGVKYATYWLDDQSVKSILIDYNKSDYISSWKMTIDQFDSNYSEAPFQGSALSKVFDKSNKLRNDFRNFTLIDKRN
jgi:hypothetical protein